MRTIAVLKGLLMLVLCVATIPAMTQNRSDEYVARLGKKILDRIYENEALIKNGEGASARYLITDSPTDDAPNWFFPSFTGTNAIQLWQKRGWIAQNTLGTDFSVETDNLNKWINELRNTYLSNTKYKNQKIYFVVSGIYNYDNINATDKDYDWSAVRSTSFDNDVKDKTAKGGFSDKESDLINRILSKIKESGGNAELKNIVDNESYIICFVFNLYRYFPETQIVTEYAYVDNNLAASGLHTREVSVKTPKTFIIDGYFFSQGVDRDIVNNVSSYVSSHASSTDSAANTSSENRNNYLSEFIRNVFLSFSPITASTTCATDPDLRDKLESLYSKGAGDGTYDISSSLTDLTLDTRLCLLKQLAGTTYCGDGNNWFLRLSTCENLILDLIKGTPPEQRRPLLDYFNDNNTVLKQLIGKLNDEGPGTENFSTFILTISQYAYEAYVKDFSALVTGAGYCSFLTYDPTNASKNIIADYNDNNSISFEFMNYDGPCYTQNWDANGNISYSSVKRTLKPFDFIGVVPGVDLPVNFFSDGKSQSMIGQKLFVPAVMLYWNIKRTNTKAAIKSIEIAANVAAFFTGVGEVNLTGTVLGRLFLTAEATTTFANLVVNSDEVKQAILKKEGGAEFIETIGQINNLSGAATIGYLGLAKLGQAVKFWNTYKTEFTSSSIMDFQRIGARMNDLEAALVKDGFIYTKGAKAVDALEDLFTAIKNSLVNRIAGETNMKLIYTDDELRTIIGSGVKLNLPKIEIEDIIFNGCRDSKSFTADQIVDQVNYWNVIKQRGYPNLFNSLEEFGQFNQVIKDIAKTWGLPGDKIFMQGSSLRVADKSLINDFDIAIKVDAETFNSLQTRFMNATPIVGRQGTISAEAARGKISGGNMFMDVATKGSFKGKVMDALDALYGQPVIQHFGLKDLQISIIKEGGPLDVSPYLILK
jgi:hypothetical protein